MNYYAGRNLTVNEYKRIYRMKKYFSYAIAAALTISTTAGMATANDWTLWRGPDRNGISKETGWNASALDSGAKILWRVKIGTGHSSLCVNKSKLYTMGNENGQDIVYCLSTKDGKEVWRHSYACEGGNYPGPRAMPVLENSNLYTCGRAGQVFCLDPETGKVKWSRNIVEEEKVKIPTWGIASSVWIEDNYLLLNGGSHGLALDKNTGKTIWNSGEGETSYATPVVYTIDNNKCVAVFSGTEINGVDLKTGRRLWSHPWKTSYNVHAADPVIVGDTMFISSGYGTGAALLNVRGKEPKVVWQNTKMKNHFNSSILINGNLYGVDGNTGGGALTCMEFNTGNVKWTEGGGYEGVMAADGKLIAMDKNGVLTIAAADPGGFKKISSAQVLLDNKAKNWTVPVLSNGRIYCRNSSGDLACVDVSR